MSAAIPLRMVRAEGAAMAEAALEEQVEGRVSARVHTQVVGDLAALSLLQAEWSALNDSARDGTMFLGPEWLIPWWDHFGAPAGRALQIITVRDALNGLVGLWPLFSERVKVGGVEVTRLAYLGDGATGCDHMDVLAAPGLEGEVLSACLEALSGLPWDLLDLDGMLRDSATVIALADRFPAGRATGGIVRDGKLRFVCPHIPLKGSYDDFLSGLGRRENLKRREKWLQRQPGSSIEVATTPEETPLAMERFFALHRARWAEAGGSDGIPDTNYESFHKAAAAQLAAKGRLRVYTLLAARRAVASVYGVTHDKTFFYYQSGYEPVWAGRSVGLVLLARTVQDAFAEGLTDFDFLRGNEGYKAQWARAERWTVQLRFWRGARGRAAQTAEKATKGVREALKSAVPAGLLEGARVARRALKSGASPRQIWSLVRASGTTNEGEGGR